MHDGFTIEFTADGERRRTRFEHRTAAPPDEPEWWRIEEAYLGNRWFTRGREPVAELVVDGIDTGAAETLR